MQQNRIIQKITEPTDWSALMCSLAVKNNGKVRIFTDLINTCSCEKHKWYLKNEKGIKSSVNLMQSLDSDKSLCKINNLTVTIFIKGFLLGFY